MWRDRASILADVPSAGCWGEVVEDEQHSLRASSIFFIVAFVMKILWRCTFFRDGQRGRNLPIKREQRFAASMRNPRSAKGRNQGRRTMTSDPWWWPASHWDVHGFYKQFFLPHWVTSWDLFRVSVLHWDKGMCDVREKLIFLRGCPLFSSVDVQAVEMRFISTVLRCSEYR
jgi:hypothetical protein